MERVIKKYLEKFNKEHKRNRRLGGVFLVLALLVTMGISWQLRFTGIALTNATYCGLEEHTHTDECYEEVLICELEESDGEEGHTHTDECYTEVSTLVCSLEESAGHVHTADCYQTVETYVCVLNEGDGAHTHTSLCYDEEGNLICGLEESAGHVHSADCIQTSEVLVCGMEEGEGAHTHTDACYETTTELTCGLEEGEAVAAHTHTEECYEKVLVCELEEHTHTAECLIDETADVETASDWEATLPTSLTGTWAENLVAVAKSQLGYSESTANYQLDDDGTTHKGYTRYGAWYGNKYGDWCAMFASFCLHYAGIPEEAVPAASGVYAWTVALNNKNLYVTDDAYTPSVGDLVFFDTDSDGTADHVGIIVNLGLSGDEVTTIYAIEGNSSDAVKQNTYSISDSTITGYADLDAAHIAYIGESMYDEELAEEDESESESETEIESESDTEDVTEDESDMEDETEDESETDTEIETETEEETTAAIEITAEISVNVYDLDGEIIDVDTSAVRMNIGTGASVTLSTAIDMSATNYAFDRAEVVYVAGETAETVENEESEEAAENEKTAETISSAKNVSYEEGFVVGTSEGSISIGEVESLVVNLYYAEAVTYTASDSGVTVTVVAPAGALPENAVLSVTLYDEDSDEYAAAGEAVGFDAEDEETGMAALDISFYADGEKVEPSKTVSVTIDVAEILPEEADTTTVEVQHLDESTGEVEPTLVADAAGASEGTVDTETAVAEFEVESFSTYTITWSSGNATNASRTSITATTYLYGTSSTIGSGTTSLTGTTGSAFDLTSSNSDLAIDGYTLVKADVSYSGNTYEDVDSITVTVQKNGNGNSATTTYTYSYTKGETTSPLYSGNSSQTVTISLYYVETAGITISATGSDTSGYTLSATTKGSYNTYSDKTWSISDSTVATLETNSDGTASVKWSEGATTGDTVTVTVSSTYTNYLGETETVTDTYMLTNGKVDVTITVYYGSNSSSTRSGASVSLYDSDGNFVTSGTTGSDGTVTLSVLPGTYTVVANYVSGNSSYGNGNGDERTFSTTETTASVNINTSKSYSMANHVDLEVTGTLDLSINGTPLSFTTYVYSGSISVTTPDGTNIGSDGELQSSNVTGYSYEYRISANVSMQWDSNDGAQLFSMAGYVLISQADVQKYIDNGTITEAQAAAIFGEVTYYEAVTYTSNNTTVTVVPAGYYYKIEFSDYHPEKNVCAADADKGRGYDFVLDIDEALSYLEDMLTVSKYVVDEEGNIIEDDTTDFTFTLQGADSNTSSYSGTAQLSSGESQTFEDLMAGYYMVTESSSTGYIPVTVTAKGDGTYTVAQTGYVQYVQSDIEKEEGEIASVTFYNLKLTKLGVVKLQKEVEGDASSTYSSNTFTFRLYTESDSEGYTQVSDLGDITVSAGGSTEFYLAAGEYTIVEIGNVTSGDSQTVSIGDSTLKRTVAGDNDPYGLPEGTVYYVGTITVTAGASLTYTVTNTYTSSVDVTLKKVSKVSDGETEVGLEGARFTLTALGETEGTSYTTSEDGTVKLEGLSDGSYTLTETAAPDGYNILNGTITLTVSSGNVEVSYSGTDANTVTVSTGEDGSIIITVTNTAGAVLPSTGSTGILPYTMAGMLILLSAAYLMYKKSGRKGDMSY